MAQLALVSLAEINPQPTVGWFETDLDQNVLHDAIQSRAGKVLQVPGSLTTIGNIEACVYPLFAFSPISQSSH